MAENKNFDSKANDSEAGPASMNPGQMGADLKTADQKVIEDLQKQVEKYKSDFLYARAEFENYKRNVIKERSELLKYGAERVIIDLLGILDNFDRALETKTTAENFETFVKGIQMTATELRAALSKNGVQEVKSEGLPFDPMIHEALGSEPTDAMAEGHIFRVFKKAYRLHDKVVRAAQVIVAKSK